MTSAHNIIYYVIDTQQHFPAPPPEGDPQIYLFGGKKKNVSAANFCWEVWSFPQLLEAALNAFEGLQSSVA